MARVHATPDGNIPFTAQEEKIADLQIKEWEDGAYDRAMIRIREERGRFLAETDWMGNSDLIMSDAWKIYRQALRDITSGLDTVDKVNAVTWPTKPE